MKFVVGLIFALISLTATQSALAANSLTDRSKLDQDYINGVTTNAIEDLNVMGVTLMCVWANSSLDQIAGYMNASLRIVLKAVPTARVNMPTHPDSARVCVWLERTRQ